MRRGWLLLKDSYRTLVLNINSSESFGGLGKPQIAEPDHRCLISFVWVGPIICISTNFFPDAAGPGTTH